MVTLFISHCHGNVLVINGVYSTGSQISHERLIGRLIAMDNIGYKIVIAHGLLPEYNYSASASPRPRIIQYSGYCLIPEL